MYNSAGRAVYIVTCSAMPKLISTENYCEDEVLLREEAVCSCMHAHKFCNGMPLYVLHSFNKCSFLHLC